MADFTGVCSSAARLFLSDGGNQTFWAAMILSYPESGCDSEVAGTTFSSKKWVRPQTWPVRVSSPFSPVIYLRMGTVAKFD